eukprot:TRINITY_DN1857_c0_g2_i1.p1 TRINITY_DN1857_c0_g2~~TRINITY_DN1857_c0_g2_i1.p1  ORF type:complete len:122 (+),score=8.75 TRINITY_DN1857_c0_g2_i1:1231-1596(+)
MKTEISFLPSSSSLILSSPPTHQTFLHLPALVFPFCLTSFHSLFRARLCTFADCREKIFPERIPPTRGKVFPQKRGKCSSFLHFSSRKSGRIKCRFYYAMDFHNPHFFCRNWPHKCALNEN